MIVTVVFDIDDTLYLEREYVRSGFNAADRWLSANRGIEGLFERAWRAFAAGARGRIFDDVVAELGIGDESLVAELVEVYRSHRPAITLLPDARECLEMLVGRTGLACVSDGPAPSQGAKASALGLDRWLDPIVLTDELGPGFGKPHKRGFEIVERTAPVGVCVYVADNPHKDFAGPKELGWRTLRIRRPGGLHFEAESGSDVDGERPDLAGLAEELGLRAEIGA